MSYKRGTRICICVTCMSYLERGVADKPDGQAQNAQQVCHATQLVTLVTNHRRRSIWLVKRLEDCVRRQHAELAVLEHHLDNRIWQRANLVGWRHAAVDTTGHIGAQGARGRDERQCMHGVSQWGIKSILQQTLASVFVQER